MEVFTPEQLKTISAEYRSRLEGICYLDHTGSALYSDSYIRGVMNDFSSNLYGNPHSHSTIGKHCNDLTDVVRYKILQHFHTNSNEYSVVFTTGATAALKLVAESFCLSSGNDTEKGDFVYTEDNHTSVLGMRNVLAERGAQIYCLDHDQALNLFKTDGTAEPGKSNSLFVYSAQCNFSGLKYPLHWVEKVHNGILSGVTKKKTKWYCFLDAATYVSTNGLNLTEVQPDFVCVSFYKLFGYPTGLGALLVRNKSADVLIKNYYGGGTVLVALSSEMWHVPKLELHERLEDGTNNFLSIIALIHGFNTFYKMVGNMESVSRHCFEMAKYAFYSLLSLHHGNGAPAVHLYADTPYDDITTQGNIVNFNMLRPNGDFIGYAEVLNMANLHGVQLRTGCFCNPGSCRRHLNLSIENVKKQFEMGHVCGDDVDLLQGRPTGSVRISFGHYTTKSDIDLLLDVLEKCFVLKPVIQKVPVKWPTTMIKLRNKFGKDAPIERNKWHMGALPVRTNQLFLNPAIIRSSLIGVQGQARLSHIFLYPVKSCGAFAVSQWELGTKGLKYDRQWMIVTPSGVALTQKLEIRLCLIKPIIDLRAQKLTLTFDGFDNISVDLKSIQSQHCLSKVCNDRVQGSDCGDRVGDWLSAVLDRPGLRLISQDDVRINKKTLNSLSLSNQAQYLLINATSVAWLTDQLDDDSDCPKEGMLHRFRSNFVVSGVQNAFAEQKWSKVKIGNTEFRVDGPCGRCQMICINQDTGEKSKEPLTTIAAAFQGKLKFGIYLSKANNENARVSIGDIVTYFEFD